MSNNQHSPPNSGSLHLLKEHKLYEELEQAFSQLTELNAVATWLDIRAILTRSVAAQALQRSHVVPESHQPCASKLQQSSE
jgi:hypothetical protein